MKPLLLLSFAAVVASNCVVNNRATECVFQPGNNRTENLKDICENATFKKSTSLKLLGHNNLKSFGNNPFELCNEVESIVVSSTTINVLNKNAFNGFKKLVELHLYGNSITKIESEAIVDLPSLENLTLNDNSVNHIGDGAFNLLPRLKVLDLRGNKLKVFIGSSMIVGANSLEIIMLERNDISEILKNSFGGFEHLKEIDISSNPLKNISEGSFANTPHLQKLVLKNNKLGHHGFSWDSHRLKNFSAPTYFQSSHELEYLDLTMNDISEVTEQTFAGLKRLKYLYLTFNKIANISEGAFEEFGELNLLHLSWNPLKNFSSCVYFRRVSRLEKLYLAGNSISNISSDAFRCLQHLKHLYISTSQLGSNIPKDIFANMPDLKNLVLQKIDLQSFFAPNLLENSQNVEKLNLGFNKISTINSRSFKGLPHLSELILEYNTVDVIERDAFKFSKELEIIDLSHNKITSFVLPKDDPDYLPKLRELNLLKNPFTVVPSEFFSVLKNLEKMRIFQDEFYCNCLNETQLGRDSSKSVYLYNDDEEYPNYKVYGMVVNSHL